MRFGHKGISSPDPFHPIATRYSLLPTPYSLLHTPYTLLPTPFSMHKQAAREQAAREQAAREQAAREQAACEQATREHAHEREGLLTLHGAPQHAAGRHITASQCRTSQPHDGKRVQRDVASAPTATQRTTSTAPHTSVRRSIDPP